MPRPSSPLEVVGLFPTFGKVGGVQLSGRVAWDAIRHRYAGVRVALGEPLEPREPGLIRARGWSQAAVASWRLRRRARWGVVWHVAMLRLVPFLRPTSGWVVFLHGIECWSPLGPVVRSALQGSSLLLANSCSTWDRFTERHPQLARLKHGVVPLGAGEPSEGSTTPASPPAAVMVGRLEERYKGHREVLAAWPGVRRRIEGAELWIAGDGPRRDRLARGARGIEGVSFLGSVSNAEKEDRVSRARCLLMPSRGEGFGLAYLEAMRLGRPCLVSGLDAGAEVVGPPEAGLAADPADQGALIDAIVRLMTPGPEWDAWSLKARARYERRYTAARFQGRLLSALEPLLSS